jgi:transcriptional antiterminator RfaH
MARCDAQGLLKPVDALKAGDEITITTGPFANFVGTVQGLAPQQRVWVLLELLGNLTRVAVKQKSVQKI